MKYSGMSELLIDLSINPERRNLLGEERDKYFSIFLNNEEMNVIRSGGVISDFVSHSIGKNQEASIAMGGAENPISSR